MVSSLFTCRGSAIVPADMRSLCGNRKARGSGRPAPAARTPRRRSRPGLRWCASPASSAGASQRASSSSSLSTGSPASQRAAKHRMTKCRSTRPCASRTITSRWPASATGSIVERGLLAHFARHRLDQRLAGFDHAARQRVDAERRLARAPHHQHLAVADDGGADREIGALRIGSRVGIFRMIVAHPRVEHASICGSSAVDHRLRRIGAGVGSPLITAPARATSGLSQAAARSASAMADSGGRSAAHRRAGCLQHGGHGAGQACRDSRAGSDRRRHRRRSPARGP